MLKCLAIISVLILGGSEVGEAADSSLARRLWLLLDDKIGDSLKILPNWDDKIDDTLKYPPKGDDTIDILKYFPKRGVPTADVVWSKLASQFRQDVVAMEESLNSDERRSAALPLINQWAVRGESLIGVARDGAFTMTRVYTLSVAGGAATGATGVQLLLREEEFEGP